MVGSKFSKISKINHHTHIFQSDITKIKNQVTWRRVLKPWFKFQLLSIRRSIGYKHKWVNGISKLSLTNLWPFLMSLTLLNWPKNHGVLKVLIKIQFHHNIFDLTDTKPLRTTLIIWQVFTLMKLNLNMNETMILNFVIRF